MFVNRRLSVAALIAGAAVFGFGSAAMADISDIVLQIEATNELGTAMYQGHLSQGTFYPDTGEYIWELRAPVQMLNASGVPIATINVASNRAPAGSSVRCVDDPIVQLNFSVSAGSLNTTFTITSPTLSFATITQAEGRATAGVSVSDIDGDGASLWPANGPSMYTSRYNGAVPGGTLFADLLGAPVVALPFDSNSATQSSPGGGLFSAIADPVSNMSSRFRFSLTANDEASGTSSYEIRPVPAPGALALVGLGGLIAGRRRRH